MVKKIVAALLIALGGFIVGYQYGKHSVAHVTITSSCEPAR